jgi:uncharacterized phage protein (TIGR02220 family)
MATGKKKVIVYTDWINQFKDLTDEEAGKLIKHFFEYINDLNPTSDRLTELLFNPIKATLKRDLEAWESKQQTNKENGAKGGRPKKNIETEINPNNPVGLLETQNNPQKGVSVNVSVNDINNNNIVESIDYDYLLKYINETLGRSFKVVNDKVKTKYKSLFKQGYTKAQIKEAIDNVKNNQYHKDSNYTYCTLEFFSRPETIDKYSSVTKVQDNEVVQDDYYLNIMKKLNQQ